MSTEHQPGAILSGTMDPKPTREEIERFRAMTPAQRLSIALELTDQAWRELMKLPPEEAQRILDAEREPWNLPERP
jgi:hypothetical protein